LQFIIYVSSFILRFTV